MLAVEQRYALQTRYAVDRTDADPMRLSRQSDAAHGAGTIVGEVGVVLARLAEARAETNRLLGDVAPGGDDAPDGVGGPRRRRAVSVAPVRRPRRGHRFSARRPCSRWAGARPRGG